MIWFSPLSRFPLPASRTAAHRLHFWSSMRALRTLANRRAPDRLPRRPASAVDVSAPTRRRPQRDSTARRVGGTSPRLIRRRRSRHHCPPVPRPTRPSARGDDATEEPHLRGQHLARRVDSRRPQAPGVAGARTGSASRLDSPGQADRRVLRQSALEADGDSRRDPVRPDAREARHGRRPSGTRPIRRRRCSRRCTSSCRSRRDSRERTGCTGSDPIRT